MKKETIVWVLLALFIASMASLLSLGGVAASVLVSNTYEMEGTGEVKRSIDIKTSPDIASGQKFSETMYTVLRGTSQFNLTQDIEATLTCNESDILVYGNLAGTETRASQYLRNYDLGSIHGYEFNGATNLEYEYAADNYTSMMHVKGETLDIMQYTIKLKDLEGHKTIFDESFEVKGYARYDIDSVMENVSYPASGIGGDWLGCP
jgi:hypothetical protein